MDGIRAMEHSFYYQVDQEKIYHPDIGEYVTYGVKIISAGSVCVMDVISDVSVSERKVTELIRICNELDLRPCHLRDVIEDFLAE